MSENESYRVLVVDEGPDADRTARSLGRPGTPFLTRVAETPDQAVAHVTTGGGVDCVVCSLDVGGVDATDVVERVREHAPDLPVVLFTDVDTSSIEGSELFRSVAGAVQRSGDPAQYDRLAARVLEAVGADRTSVPVADDVLLEPILDHASDAILTIDESSTIQYASGATRPIFGYDADELVGESLTTLIPERLASRHESGVERYIATGERSLDWSTVEFPGRHRDGHEVPLSVSFGEFERDGRRYFTGIVRDVSDRRDRERELGQYEAMVETIDDGVFVLDSELRFRTVNDALVEMTGRSRSDLVGAHVATVVAEMSADDIEKLGDEIWDEDRNEGRVEIMLKTADGDSIPVETRLTKFTLADGSPGHVGVTRDVSEQKRLEDELRQNERRYRTLVEMSPDPILVHADGVVVYANRAFVDQVGADDEDDVLGTEITDYLAPDEREDAIETARKTQRGEAEPTNYRRVLETLTGETRYVATTSRPITYEGSAAVLTIVKDETDRQQYHDAVEALHEHTREMFQRDTSESVAQLAVTAVTDLLDLPGATVFAFDESENALEPVARSQDADDRPGDASAVAAGDDSVVWDTFVSGEQTLVTRPSDLDRSPTDGDGGSTTAGLYVPLGNYGVFAVESGDDAELSETAVELCSILAANLDAALDGIRREQQLRERDDRLEQQTAELQELDHLNSLIRDVIQSILQATTPESIEAAVCELLADRDEYSAVWIGQDDDESGRVVPTTTDGSRGGLTNWIRDEESGDGLQSLLRRALDHGDAEYVPRVIEAESPGLDRQVALKYGFRSLLVVPIRVWNDRDRVLVVHARASDAFTDRQREVFVELGELIGAAIAALGSNRGPVGETVTEVDLEIADERFAYNRASGILDAELSLQGAVPVGDGRLVAFVETAVSREEVERLVDAIDQFDSVERLAENEGTGLFKVEGPLTPFFETLYGRDAELVELHADDQTTRATLWISEAGSVRDLLEDIVADYPDTELRAKRSREAPRDTPLTFMETLQQKWTDRQFQALQAAYHGGFYDWPRGATNEDLAEVLGVSSPTFQFHLRAAERVLVSTLFERTT